MVFDKTVMNLMKSEKTITVLGSNRWVVLSCLLAVMALDKTVMNSMELGKSNHGVGSNGCDVGE
jgi:hypothetical protein